MSELRRPGWSRALRTSGRVAIVVVIGVPLFIVTTTGAALGLLLFGNLPGSVPEENPQIQSLPSYVYDSWGVEIGSFRQFDLTVPMERGDVPVVLKEAVVSAEDRKFWSHRGVDPEGIVRAAWAIYEEGRVVQGGSTITQQYARLRYLTPDVRLDRKLQEAILATRLERDLTDELGSKEAAKEEILYRYLDTVYFGGGAYGAGAAAASYFAKDVNALTLSEAATLAGVLPSPSAYSPREHTDRANEQRILVLDAMLETGAITEAERDEAAAQRLWYLGAGPPPEGQPVTVVVPAPTSGARDHEYFVDHVYQELLALLGPEGEERLFSGGLRIETTIDPHMQELAEQAVARGLEGTEWPVEMSLVAVEPGTGYVKALVGGRDFAAHQVNLATGGSLGMQAGSAFKPFTAAVALENGLGVGTTYPGGPFEPPGGCPDEPDGCTLGGNGGPMDVAMAASSNNYFVRLVLDVGTEKVAELANRMGVRRIDPAAPHTWTITLGAYEVSPLDMAAGFSTFADHGRRRDPTPILRVLGPDGTVLIDHTAPAPVQVLDPAVADTVTQMMEGVIQSGTGRRADIGRPAAGKTGTTNDNRAAWFVGYTPQLVAAVWMGHADSPRPLQGIGGFGEVGGGSIPAATWSRFMGPAHEGLEVLGFAPPGPLPAPGSGAPGARSAGGQRRPAEVVPDCGQPCIRELPRPESTTPPPPPAAGGPAPGPAPQGAAGGQP